MIAKQTHAINQLIELSLIAQKERYPSVPAHALTKAKYSDKTANGLTKCIVDFIRFTHGQAERISSEGRVIDTRKTHKDVIGRTVIIGSVKRIKASSQVGTADISATINGRSVKIEVKIGKDRQSEVQKAYQHQVERAGGIYVIAKDFQSFFDWYQATFEPKKINYPQPLATI